jgi:hypothetical protein
MQHDTAQDACLNRHLVVASKPSPTAYLISLRRHLRHQSSRRIPYDLDAVREWKGFPAIARPKGEG